MIRSGNKCTLIEYVHAHHGFHYPGNGAYFDDVIDATVRFIFEQTAGSDV